MTTSSMHALARAWRRAFEHYQSLAKWDDTVWHSETGLSLLDRWNQRERQLSDKFERLYSSWDLYDTAFQTYDLSSFAPLPSDWLERERLRMQARFDGGEFARLQIESAKRRLGECPHIGAVVDPDEKPLRFVAFDAEEAKTLPDGEVRKRFPRGTKCLDCGAFGAFYASFEHYIAGDW